MRKTLTLGTAQQQQTKKAYYTKKRLPKTLGMERAGNFRPAWATLGILKPFKPCQITIIIRASKNTK